MRELRRSGDFRQLQRHLQVQHRLPVGRHYRARPGTLHVQGNFPITNVGAEFSPRRIIRVRIRINIFPSTC